MHRPHRPLLLAALVALSLACGQATSVVGGPIDAAAAPDVGVDLGVDLGAPDVSDAPDVFDAPEAPVDAPDAPSDVPFACARDADCAGRAEGAVCEVATGRCVRCLPAADTCPAGQFCVAGTNTCAPGSRNDEGCAAGATDAGAAPARRCDVLTRACVECVTDDHCPPGNLCVGSLCVTGCNAGRACPAGLSCCSGACVDTQSNVAACGACDQRCAVPNGAAACLNGTCSVATCTPPNADCDMAAGNGCEVNTQGDLAHCGACNAACPTRANATSTCTAGACGFTCNTGFENCDGDASNGCEVDTRASASHCGGCGRACAPPNAAGACVAGACTVGACAANFGDCDGNPSNGCEVDTRSSASHCGACAAACPAPANSVPACVGSTCLRTCAVGFDDCDLVEGNGCEVNLRTSNAHCGRCGQACTLANGSATCVSGTCTLTACAAGYGDCDASRANGCEVDLNTATASCGACGRACAAPANASAVCAAGACGYTCNPGFGDCDGMAANGCEVDLATSVAHCGRCGATCATGVCTGGVCQPARCDDRVRNGAETDVDCGGSGTCPRCPLCLGCASGADCVHGACSAAGRCTFRTQVTVGWFDSCQGPDRAGAIVRVSSVPAGDYVVTALPSAGIVWSSVSLPGQGWSWRVPCENLSVPALSTGSTYYATPEAAFAGLPTTTSTVPFAGGELRCFFTDSACSDNRGSSIFAMERVCP
ncbi:MAG: hypothetical protein Q8S73_34540 [Deltaproteobacteria bacterium]|nr:hypothetical protein [Deltaproteobacteria bacterium]